MNSEKTLAARLWPERFMASEQLMASRLWRERLATLALFVGNGLGIGAWAAAIPRFKSSLALSDLQLSMVLLAFAAGAVISMPLAGIFVARTGTRKASIGAALAFAVALLLPPFAGSLMLLAVAAFLLGLSNGALDVSMNAHASGVETRWGGAIMSSFHAAFSLGGLIGAAGGAMLGVYATGLVLWVPAALACALALCALPLLGGDDSRGKSAGPALAFPGRAALALCVIALLCMLVEGAMADWTGVYLASIGDPMRAAAGYAAFSLTMTVGRLTGDRVVNAQGRARVIEFGGALALVGLAIVAIAPTAAWAVPGFALVGLGLANVVPSVFSAAAQLGGSASAGVAMVATAGYTCFLAGPPVVGMIASFTGLRAAIGVLALASGLVVAVALLAFGRRRQAWRGASRVAKIASS